MCFWLGLRLGESSGRSVQRRNANQGFFVSEVDCTSTLRSRTSGDCLAEHGSGSGRGARRGLICHVEQG